MLRLASEPGWPKDATKIAHPLSMHKKFYFTVDNNEVTVINIQYIGVWAW
jgi:hypothetical protein